MAEDKPEWAAYFSELCNAGHDGARLDELFKKIAHQITTSSRGVMKLRQYSAEHARRGDPEEFSVCILIQVLDMQAEMQGMVEEGDIQVGAEWLEQQVLRAWRSTKEWALMSARSRAFGVGGDDDGEQGVLDLVADVEDSRSTRESQAGITFQASGIDELKASLEKESALCRFITLADTLSDESNEEFGGRIYGFEAARIQIQETFENGETELLRELWDELIAVLVRPDLPSENAAFLYGLAVQLATWSVDQPGERETESHDKLGRALREIEEWAIVAASWEQWDEIDATLSNVEASELRTTLEATLNEKRPRGEPIYNASIFKDLCLLLEVSPNVSFREFSSLVAARADDEVDNDRCHGSQLEAWAALVYFLSLNHPIPRFVFDDVARRLLGAIT